MQIDYSYYEKEQQIRANIVEALALACHPDHLKRVELLVKRLKQHMQQRSKLAQLSTQKKGDSDE